MSESQPKRRQAIPILYTRGTHFEVGFDVGRTFESMIKEFLEVNVALNDTLLPAYSTPEGTKFYNDTLATVEKSFPQYLKELEGIAEGAQVEFHKLFVLHLGNMLPQYLKMVNRSPTAEVAPASSGALSIIVNNYYNRYIAHTEDITPDMLNYAYIIDAHIINEEPLGKYKTLEEHFTSFCYPGHLPGFSINSNHHGLVFAVNKLTPSTVAIGKTPSHFLARALLAAQQIEEVAVILSDEGIGIADGFSLSIASINDRMRKCFIMEVGPALVGALKSELHIREIEPGSFDCHANIYQNLNIDHTPNIFVQISPARLTAIEKFDAPRTKGGLLEIMCDKMTFLDDANVNRTAMTYVLGVIDLSEKSLTLYFGRPEKCEPLLQIPLFIKCDCRVYVGSNILKGN